MNDVEAAFFNQCADLGHCTPGRSRAHTAVEEDVLQTEFRDSIH